MSFIEITQWMCAGCQQIWMNKVASNWRAKVQVAGKQQWACTTAAMLFLT